MRSAYSNFTLGKVGFEGLGGFQEKAVSELLAKGIPLQNIRFSNGIITGEASPPDYYTIAETMRKNGVKIRSKKRSGLYFTLSRYRFRAGLYAGLIFFVMYLSLWQTRVQDINITGDVSTDLAMSILEECGIRKGASASKLNMSRAEHMLMIQAPDCAWADVSQEGFRVNVHVEKGTETPIVAPQTPCNVTASRPAKIVRQIVRKGFPALSNGSGVNTGDLLVSGTVSDGRDHVLLVHADAEIIGEWNETTDFFVPFSDTVQIPSGKQKKFKYLVLGDDEYPLFTGRAEAENSVYSEETSYVRLFGQTTSVKIKTGIFTEYETKEITRSADDAIAGLKRRKENYEHNFFSDYEIVNAYVSYFPQEDGIRMVVEYVLQGNIAKSVEIEYDDSSLPPAAESEPLTSE